MENKQSVNSWYNKARVLFPSTNSDQSDMQVFYENLKQELYIRVSLYMTQTMLTGLPV